MNIIPDFLLKRLYCKGSLRQTQEGIAFDLKNLLGSGAITGISFVKINDDIYESPMIKIITAGISMMASQITPADPVKFRLNQEGTLLLLDARGLKEGINRIIMEIISKDAGPVRVTLTDSITA